VQFLRLIDVLPEVDLRLALGESALAGINLTEFDEHGKITDFMVMMRLASAVLALAAEAGKRLAAAPAP
jgi:hypothetical protein